MKYNDWMPPSRDEQLAMCGNWIEYMTPERRTAWGIPEDQFTDLEALYTAARTLLQKSADAAERTHVVTVQTREAFKAMKDKMRFFRNHYFKMPALDLSDWTALGFREKSARKTKTPPPGGTPAVSLAYPGGPHVITAYLGPMAGTEELEPSSVYGCAVYVGIMPQGGATLEEAASEKHYLMKPPKDGKGLRYYCFTRRRKEQLVFDAGDSGKTAYVCCRYEKGKGDVGVWGPVASAVIP
jgi:hypothetical protein